MMALKLKNSPELIANELEENQIVQLKEFYEKLTSKKTYFFNRHIINLVFSTNRFLFALISSALTGVSVNIITGFLEYEKMECTHEKIKILVLLLCSILFTVSIVLFTAKISQIQESGKNYILIDSHILNHKKAILSENNIILYHCMKNIKYLNILYILIIVSGVSTIIFLFWGVHIINIVERGFSCLINQFQR